MRTINEIILHCSASDNPRHDNIATIKDWHVNGNGWSDIGYHFFIDKKGQIHEGRPLSKKGAHCKGHNSKSIGICLSGLNDFTDEQFESLKILVMDLMFVYGIDLEKVVGHNFHTNKKACPVFDWQKRRAEWKK